MMELQKIWENFVGFLAEYDIRKILEEIRNLDWQKLVTEPLFWLAGLSFLAFMVWKKKFRVLLFMVSCAAFLYLLQSTLPPVGEEIPLEKILTFIGGSVALIVVNLYFLFVRQN